MGRNNNSPKPKEYNMRNTLKNTICQTVKKIITGIRDQLLRNELQRFTATTIDRNGLPFIVESVRHILDDLEGIL